MVDQEIMKKSAGEKAAQYVKENMIVGLGTGSTVFYFIEKLIELCKQGLNIKAISSSFRSLQLAKEGGIPLANSNEVTLIDLTIDGADEIDAEKRMIKGGGGALFREKILASSSRDMLVIVDETKVVKRLGKQKLPVEILPFAPLCTISKINKLGFKGQLRRKTDKKLFFTDNGNLIYDIVFETVRIDPERDHEKLIHIPGILETGFFCSLAKKVIVGHLDGSVSSF